MVVNKSTLVIAIITRLESDFQIVKSTHFQIKK